MAMISLLGFSLEEPPGAALSCDPRFATKSDGFDCSHDAYAAPGFTGFASERENRVA